MAVPPDFAVDELGQRVAGLSGTVATAMERVERVNAAVARLGARLDEQAAEIAELRARLATYEAVHVLDAEIAGIRDGMADDVMRGGAA